MSESARTLLTEEELTARAVELSRVPESVGAARGDELVVIVMRLGAEWLAVRATHVHEVVSRPVLTPLPLAPECVAGVLNLRGEILAALDVQSMLGLGRNPNAEPRDGRVRDGAEYDEKNEREPKARPRFLSDGELHGATPVRGDCEMSGGRAIRVDVR